MVSAKAIELIAHCIETSKDSYDKISAGSTISKATISRVVQQHKASRYTLDMLASYFEVGEKYHELVGDAEHSCAFASELAEELRNTRAYYEEKAVAVRQHYEEQLAALREQNARQEADRSRERETQQRTYDSSLAYLREDNSRLREENTALRKDLAEANQSAVSLATKKYVVVWILGILNALSLASLILSLVL